MIDNVSYSLFCAALCIRVSWSRPYWTCCHCTWDYLLSFKVPYRPDFCLHISHSHWSIFRILSIGAHCISTGLGTKAQLLYGVCQCSNTRINQWNVPSTSYKFVYIRKCTLLSIPLHLHLHNIGLLCSDASSSSFNTCPVVIKI